MFLEYQDDCIIARNLFEGLRSSSAAGIGLDRCGGTFLLEKNKIEVTGGQTAVTFAYCTTSSLIFRNNFVATPSTNINISWTSNAQVVNNSFHNISGSGFNMIIANNITNLDIYNNAIRNTGEGIIASTLSMLWTRMKSTWITTPTSRQATSYSRKTTLITTFPTGKCKQAWK